MKATGIECSPIDSTITIQIPEDRRSAFVQYLIDMAVDCARGSTDFYWRLIHATPLQRLDAARAALEGK